MNIEFEVGGGGAIGGFMICDCCCCCCCCSFTSFAAAVSLTFAANVCETTVAVDMEEVGTADLGGTFPVDIMIALVYDIVVFVLVDGADADELAVTAVAVMITWLGFLSTIKRKQNRIKA